MAFVTDQDMEKNKDKELIDKLKQVQSLEKIATNEKTPETASAARELIERLKQPREQQVDIRPMLALASPSVGQRLMQAVGKPSAFSPEEERLAKAASLEQQIADEEAKKLALISKLTIGNTGNQEQDYKALERVSQMASGTGRGATNMRKSWENIASIDKLKSMVEDFKSGKLTFDKQSVAEYSNAVTALITNKAPGIEILRETAYKNFGGDINAMVQYMTGNPKEYLSSKMANEVERQVYNIEKSEKHKVSKTLSRLFNAYRHRFKKNPEEAQIWKEQYGHIVDFNLNDMKASPKKYDESIETRFGKEPISEEVEVISPDGVEGTIPMEDLQEALNTGYRRVK